MSRRSSAKAGSHSDGFDKAYESMNGEPFTRYTPFTRDPVFLPVTAKFPTDAMPEPCRRLIEEGSESVGCPPDFIGLPMLTTLGAAIGNSRRVRVKGGWDEGAAIYAAVIAEPGDKKTPAQKLAVAPAEKVQARLRKEHRDQVDEHERELREYEVDRADAKKQGLAAPPPPRPPVMSRTVVGDTTVEALARIQSENPRGVLVNRDELTAWVRAMDQYKGGGKGADRQFWLSAHSNSPASFDRKGSPEPVILARPFVNVFGSIQPDVLPELHSNREDGLLERFLFAYPDPVLSDWTDYEVSDGAIVAYARLYEKLLDGLEVEKDENGDPEPRLIEFSVDAKAAFVEAMVSHADERRAVGFPRELKRVFPKLEGYLARLCLILALCRAVSKDRPERVEVSDVRAAATLLRYFKSQAYRVYTALYGESEEDRFASDLASFLADRGGSFEGSPSDMFEAFESDQKPKNVSWLTKRIEAVAKTYDALDFETRTEGFKAEGTKTGRSTRRIISLSLRNGVNGVNGVNAWKGQR